MPSSPAADTLETYERLGLVEQLPGTTVFRDCTINVASHQGQVAAGDGSQIGGQGGENVLASDSAAAASRGAAASAGAGSAVVGVVYRTRWRRSAFAITLAIIAVVVAIATTAAVVLGWTDAAIGGYAIAVAAFVLSAFAPLIQGDN